MWYSSYLWRPLINSLRDTALECGWPPHVLVNVSSLSILSVLIGKITILLAFSLRSSVVLYVVLESSQHTVHFRSENYSQKAFPLNYSWLIETENVTCTNGPQGQYSWGVVKMLAIIVNRTEVISLGIIPYIRIHSRALILISKVFIKLA